MVAWIARQSRSTFADERPIKAHRSNQLRILGGRDTGAKECKPQKTARAFYKLFQRKDAKAEKLSNIDFVGVPQILTYYKEQTDGAQGGEQ